MSLELGANPRFEPSLILRQESAGCMRYTLQRVLVSSSPVFAGLGWALSQELRKKWLHTVQGTASN